MTSGPQEGSIVCTECSAWFPSHEADNGPKGFRCKSCSGSFYKATVGDRLPKYVLAVCAMIAGLGLVGFAVINLLTKNTTITNILIFFAGGVVAIVFGADLLSKTRPARNARG